MRCKITPHRVGEGKMQFGEVHLYFIFLGGDRGVNFYKLLELDINAVLRC